MTTAYDWITVALFAALVVLFLHRSDQAAPGDSLWQYLLAAAGCALVDRLGNGGRHLAAVAALAGVLAFVALALKPWLRRR